MNQEWDSVVNAKKKNIWPDLKEVWNFRDLVFLFVKRDFVSIYKQTLLGPIWLFIQPLTTTFIYVFIFGNLANLGTDGLPKPLFYLTGIVSWTFFSEVFTKSSGIFLANSHIFTKVYFPRLIIIISVFFSSLIRMGIQLLLLISLMIYFILNQDFHFNLTWHLLFLPIIVFLIALIGIGLGMIVSSLTIKYRDLNNLIQFGVQLLMYATPVVYSMASMPSKYKKFILYNPLAPLIEGIRFCSFGAGELSFSGLLFSLTFGVIIFLTGLLAFKISESDFIDNI